MPGKLLHFKQRHARGDQARAECVPQVVPAKLRCERCSFHRSLEPPAAINSTDIPFGCDEDLLRPRAPSHACKTPARISIDPDFARPRLPSHVQHGLFPFPLRPPRVELFAPPHSSKNREFNLVDLSRAIAFDRGDHLGLLMTLEIANVDFRLWPALHA